MTGVQTCALPIYGCTSGNGISGGLQLALSGWVFLAVMFITGTITAFILFRPKTN